MNWIRGLSTGTAAVAAIALGMGGCAAEDEAPQAAADEDAAVTAAADEALAHDIISVEGMTCSVCVASVRRQLRGVDGVGAADVSLADRQARVAYDPTKVSGAELADLIDAGSFTAHLIEAEDNAAADED